MKKWETLRDMPADMLSEEVISLNNKAFELYKRHDFNGAIQVLYPVIKIIDLLFQNFHNRKFMKQDLHLDQVCGLIADTYGAIDDAKNALKFYEYHHFMKMQLKHDFESENCVKLYQFRRFSEYSIANLLKREITISHPSVMNDINDTLIINHLSSPNYGQGCYDQKHLPYFKKSYDDYRIASFCSDDYENGRYAISNVLMWTHYAQEHMGFCIEYQFSPEDYMRNDIKSRTASRLFRIRYASSNSAINVDEQKTTELAFLTKSFDWKYENEVRMLQYKPANGALRQQYSLNSETKISAIYFGVRCPDSTISIIRKLIDSNIPLYKMKIDYSDIFNLKYEII